MLMRLKDYNKPKARLFQCFVSVTFETATGFRPKRRRCDVGELDRPANDVVICYDVEDMMQSRLHLCLSLCTR